MSKALYVFWPSDVFGILRSSHHKTTFHPTPSRFQQQFVQSRLPIITISSHVTQVPLCLCLFWEIERRIHRTIERARDGRSKFALNPLEHRPTSERQVNLVLRNEFLCQIIQ